MEEHTALSPTARRLFLQYGQGPIILPAFSVIHKAFENIVNVYPHSVAVMQGSISMTYQELETQSNALAWKLVQTGLQPRERVCIILQRSIEMIIGILAVLKCGCQYVPLDCAVTPAASLSHIIRDTKAAIILSLESLRLKVEKCAPPDVSIIMLDIEPGIKRNGYVEKVSVKCTEDDGAYLIYTSGRVEFKTCCVCELTF